MNDTAKRITLSRLIGGKGSLIFTLVCLAFAALFGGIGYSSARDVESSMAWPSTDGVVTYAQIEEQVTTSRDKDGRTTTQREDVLNVIYRYRVGGEEYESNRVNFGFLMSREEMEEKLALYSEGSHVMVYYDPEDPEAAVLEPGGEFFLEIYEVLINMGLFMLAVPMVYYLIRWLTLTFAPGFKVEVDQNMASRMDGATGPVDYFLRGNLIQRIAMLIVFPLLFLMWLGWMGAGFGLFYLGVDGYMHPDGSQKWPQVSGIIVRADVQPVVVRHGSSNDSSTYTRYDMEVEIEYRVLASRHKLYEYFSTNEEERAQTLRGEYPRGGRITVYYDPDDPQAGQLRPHEPHGLLSAGLGLIMTLPWLAAVFLIWRSQRKKRAASRSQPA